MYHEICPITDNHYTLHTIVRIMNWSNKELIQSTVVLNQTNCDMACATGLTIDPDTSDIYISDWKENIIQVYDGNFTCKGSFKINEKVHHPRGLRFRHGMLYVAETSGNKNYYKVKVFSRKGVLMQEIWDSHKLQFNHCLALDVDHKENIYVCDANNRVIKVTSADGNFISGFGRGKLTWPIDIRIFKTLIYVLDSRTTSMFIFDLEHNFVTSFSLPSNCHASYFAINSNGDLIFSDKHQNRLVKINGDHVLIIPLEGLDCKYKGKSVCKGIEVDKEGRIISVCQANKGILRMIEDSN